jgi:dTDP-4-dehydrorhamnose 3,5-epimerase
VLVGRAKPVPLLSGPAAWRFEIAARRDTRGSFREWYQDSAFRSATGHGLPLVQANCSVSSRGALRGIKYTDVPPGQAKYVTCLAGAVLDVVVDLRVGSPTFGAWHMERLDDANPSALYISGGLGHAVLSLADSSTVAYLLTAAHDPGHERSIHPLDPGIGIPWPADAEMILSDQDSSAPGLQEARRAGLLPDYDACIAQQRSYQHGE